MKNVMIFQDFIDEKTYGHQYKTEELFSYFKAQIDNGLRLGWKPEDICIVTNLDFNYKEATIIKSKRLCTYDKYINKDYGICEILEENLIDGPFWFHDFDDWQLLPFSYPDFEGDIGICRYINESQWNTGSVFVKPSSVDIWRLICDFADANQTHPHIAQKGDEVLINTVYHMYPEIQPRFTMLNNQYNVGCTQFERRYDLALKPIYIGAFKPGEERMELFLEKDLVPQELLGIFNKHKM